MSLLPNGLVSINFYTKQFASRSSARKGFTKWGLHLLLNKTVCNQKSFTKRSGSKNVTFTKWVGLHQFLHKTVCLQKFCTERFHKMGSPSAVKQNGLQPEVFHETFWLQKCHFYQMGWSPSIFTQNSLPPEVLHGKVSQNGVSICC